MTHPLDNMPAVEAYKAFVHLRLDGPACVEDFPIMSATVASLLKEIEKLPPSDQADLRRAIEDRLPLATEPSMTLREAELRTLAGTWDNLGPSPDVDYDAL